MDANFVKAVEDAVKARPCVLKVNGVEHLVVPGEDGNYIVEPVVDEQAGPAIPVAGALSVLTLTAIKDYLAAGIDGPIEENAKLLVHVRDPQNVSVRSSLVGERRQRETLIDACCTPLLSETFRYGTFMDLETFIINLQTRFEPTDERDKLIKVVSSIEAGRSRTSDDDGVSQVVTAKVGIARRGELTVQPRWSLTPYRTFPEVSQPQSAFVLRMRGGSDDAEPEAALFEADGGAWKAEAIESVAEYLRGVVKDKAIVIA